MQEHLAEKLNVTQQTASLRLQQMGKIQTEGIWVTYELKEWNIEQRETTNEILLARHRILTGKWIYFDNLKCM